VTHNSGSRPSGAVDETTSSELVREMFDRIAPRYDLLNHVLSCNVDRTWWWRTARRFRHILAQPEARVLDICCGTGDMTRALLERRPSNAQPVVAADFSDKMLSLARVKLAGRNVSIQSMDAMRMPFENDSLDLITTAFGFRNLPNYKAGLVEFLRVLRPGAEVGILDCSQPGGAVGKLFGFYFRHVLPAIGARISGDAIAYGYLPSSVAGFPPPPAMLALMREAGFVDVTWTPYTFGIASLWSGRKPHRG
jgi:demethylmenaquinone methyltransferase / 2-methoxy-6-polyprenyl-1,4-benzoquinol methylase